MKYGVFLCVVEQRQRRVRADDVQELFVIDVKGLGNKRLLGRSRRGELLKVNRR
jgi:hypothetical protein